MATESIAQRAAGSTASAEWRESLLRSTPRISGRLVITIVVGILAYLWGLNGTNVRIGELLDGLPNIANFVIRLFPPQWDMQAVPLTVPALVVPVLNLTLVPALTLGQIQVPVTLTALIETFQMAMIGTSMSIILAFPFGLLSARNTTPSRTVYQGTRLVLNIIRAVPDIIFALIFVSAVGLGPFGGVLALGVGSIGMMGKLYSESIEAIDPQQVLAIRATGANPIQTFAHAVIPQALPMIASYSLLLLETNVRAASILGLVGAGGIGFQISKYMALFQYRKLTGAMILVITMVTLMDRGSAYVRKKII